MRLEDRDVSDAEDLHDLGEAFVHNKKCGCKDCQLNLEKLRVKIKPWVLELAELWFKHDGGEKLNGLLNDWTDEQIAVAVGYIIPEREVA